MLNVNLFIIFSQIFWVYKYCDLAIENRECSTIKFWIHKISKRDEYGNITNREWNLYPLWIKYEEKRVYIYNNERGDDIFQTLIEIERSKTNNTKQTL